MKNLPGNSKSFTYMHRFLCFVSNRNRKIFYRNYASSVFVKHRVIFSCTVNAFTCTCGALMHFNRGTHKCPVQLFFLLNDIEILTGGQSTRFPFGWELWCIHQLYSRRNEKASRPTNGNVSLYTRLFHSLLNGLRSIKKLLINVWTFPSGVIRADHQILPFEKLRSGFNIQYISFCPG